MLFDQKIEESIKLSDGRQLGFSLLGDPEGQPLFFFPGTPGSRYCLSKDDLLAQQPGIRLILPERPGYGLSDPMPRRTILGWVDDVSELADNLGYESFYVSGSSGGGPYALACGATIPNRVKAVLLFNSAAPWQSSDATEGMAFANWFGLWTAKYTPWLLKALIAFSAKGMLKHPEASMRSLKNQLCASDKVLMDQPEYEAAILRDLQEAYRRSSAGHSSDAILMARPWGIDFEKLQTPVYLWHGEKDTLSPVHNIRQMADRIPDCHEVYIPDAGHLLIDYPDVVTGIGDVVS